MKLIQIMQTHFQNFFHSFRGFRGFDFHRFSFGHFGRFGFWHGGGHSDGVALGVIITAFLIIMVILSVGKNSKQ